MHFIPRTIIFGTAAALMACGGQQTTPAPHAQLIATPPPAMATPSVGLAQPAPQVAQVTPDPMAVKAQAHIVRAQTALTDARRNGAHLYASTALRRAEALLQTARRWRADQRLVDAIAEADRATDLAIEAGQTARPQLIQAQALARQNDARKSLYAELRDDRFLQPERTTEGVSVPVHGAFLPLDTALSDAGRKKLRTVGETALAHPTFDVVLIASRTESRSATDALLDSQNRALAASAMLERMGVAANRIRTRTEADAAGRTLWVEFVPDRRAAFKSALSAR